MYILFYPLKFPSTVYWNLNKYVLYQFLASPYHYFLVYFKFIHSWIVHKRKFGRTATYYFFLFQKCSRIFKLFIYYYKHLCWFFSKVCNTTTIFCDLKQDILSSLTSIRFHIVLGILILWSPTLCLYTWVLFVFNFFYWSWTCLNNCHFL